MRRWLVTGASGFLGTNAGRRLAGEAYLVGMARESIPAGLFDETYTVDLLDPASVSSVVQSSRPDVILHCAAMASHEACQADPQLAERVNVEATRALAEEAASAGATFVYISSDSVFNGQRGDYRETDETDPFSVYGVTKLAGERAVQESTADALIVRTNFFGWSPSGTRSILEFFVNALRDGCTVPGYVDFVVTSIYAPHLVGIIAQLVASSHRGVVHVTSVDPQSKYAFGQLVARQFGLPGEFIEPVSAPVDRDTPSRSRDLSLNTGRLAEWLGSDAPSQRAGIQAAYDDEAAVTSALRPEKEDK